MEQFGKRYAERRHRHNMPYKSKAQAAYFNMHKKKLESQGVDVNEWNESSKGMKLPEHVNERQHFHKFVKDKVRSKR
jgi:hypothetical protein